MKLKNMNFKEYTVMTHTSCLIDESFLNKYTNEQQLDHESGRGYLNHLSSGCKSTPLNFI